MKFFFIKYCKATYWEEKVTDLFIIITTADKKFDLQKYAKHI